MDDPVVGLVTFSSTPTTQTGTACSGALRSQVTIEDDLRPEDVHAIKVNFAQGRLSSISPLATMLALSNTDVPIRLDRVATRRVLLGAALYVACRGQPVAWFQLVVYIERGQLASFRAYPSPKRRPTVAFHVEARPGSGVEPRVDWATLRNDEWIPLDDERG